MILDIVFLLSGFALLIKGADYLVDGATNVARRFGVSTLVIGLTVVAFGTSAPELAVNILSAISGSTEIALGNINGSNIANILLVLGITALFIRIPVQSRTVIKEVPYMILAGVVLIVLMVDVFLGSATSNVISRSDGLILLLFFIIFLYYLFLSAKDVTKAKVERTKQKVYLSTIFVVGGLAALTLGGQITVLGATGIALKLGVSESLIALTIVALGTSLPELVTAITAVRKGETDLAIGGVVGSNIFNILLVLGTTSVIIPIVVSANQVWDAVISLGAMLLLLLFIFYTGTLRQDRTKNVSRKEGLFMILAYFAYLIYIIVRG